MKIFKGVTSFLLVAAMAASGAAAAAPAVETQNGITHGDYLTCCGTLIKNRHGEILTLRGTNLGGWLIQEQWMCNFVGADAQLPMLEKLEARFGREKTDELIKTYEDNFITEYDLDYLAGLGYNCLRVPFWYRNLQTDDNGTWKRNANGEIDFSRLDWVVEQCGKRGMYVVLDMHGLPGFQSVAHHCGKINASVLYDQTPEGERSRELSAELWREIAKHFKGNPVVAAYDLMNEPMCDFPDERKDDKMIAQTYDLLYNAVRSEDKGHIVIAECIWSIGNLPEPKKYGWDNIMYEMHLYNSTIADYRFAMSDCKSKKYGVPIYVGEFHPSDAKAPWNEILDCFNQNLCSWTTWTYKGHCKWGDSTDWFMLGSSGNEVVVDLNNDSYETILEKWTNVKTQLNYRETGDIKTLSDYAKAPINVDTDEKVANIFTIIFSAMKGVFFRFIDLFR